jgi:hypothetical protein
MRIIAYRQVMSAVGVPSPIALICALSGRESTTRWADQNEHLFVARSSGSFPLR